MSFWGGRSLDQKREINKLNKLNKDTADVADPATSFSFKQCSGDLIFLSELLV